MKWVYSCLLIPAYSAGFGQYRIDTALQNKIADMFKADQKWRLESMKIQSGKRSDFDGATINRNMAAADSLNMIEAKMIIKKYGFPGYSLAGIPGSDNFWAIVQHCDNDLLFQEKALVLMARQVKKHNAAPDKFALLQDRVLVSQGHKQLYGTQIHIDLKTHEAKPFPIQDSLNVDNRRKTVGLSPLSDYLKLFNKH